MMDLVHVIVLYSPKGTWILCICITQLMNNVYVRQTEIIQWLWKVTTHHSPYPYPGKRATHR